MAARASCRARATMATLAAVALLVAPGCRDRPSTPSSSTTAPTGTAGAPDQGPTGAPADDAATALAVCRHLVDTQTQLEEIANDALEGISSAAPDERAGPLADGYERAIARAGELQATIDELDLPEIPERGQLLDELSAGLEDAIAELEDEQAVFDEGTIPDEDVFGRAGQYLNGFEKTVASMETSLEDYPRAGLRRAFMAEPTCRFVVQPVPVGD